MSRLAPTPDDIEQRLAHDRPPLPPNLRPRVLAAIEEAIESEAAPSRPSPQRREERVVMATSILLVAVALLLVVPSLAAQPQAAPTVHSPIEAQARRLGVDLPPSPSRPMAFEESVVAMPSRPAPSILTPADVHRFLSSPF